MVKTKWRRGIAAALAAGLWLAGAVQADETVNWQGQPGEWLAAKDRPEKWVEKTARCRELLAKLKLDEPLVKKYLPNVRDKVMLVLRTPSFNWKTVTAVEFLENMLEDLLAGKVPNQRYAGSGMAFPYWSETMGRTEAIWLHVPPSYNPAKEYQLFMCYKCGGGIHFKDGRAAGGYRPSVEVANQTDTFFAWSSLNIQIKGRMNANTELAEAVPAMCREFAISPDRIFLTGYSDGGFTAIWLASRYPHLVAGIAPDCANWQYSNVNQVGLYNVPFLVVDGWGDSGYVQRNVSRWQTLYNMGYDVAGIFGKHAHTYAPYENLTEFKQILDWAKAQRRELHPKRVRYATWNLYWHRAYWLSIERMVDPALAAQIEAEVKPGNRIEVKAWNVTAYKLYLDEKLVDPIEHLTVVTNGAESYSGPFARELAIELVKPPAGRFLKTAQTPGDITAQITAATYGSADYLRVKGRTWLWVRGTGGDEKTKQLMSKWCPEHAKADAELTDQDIAEQNLFLFGGPEVNAFTARIAADLPVKFAKGGFTIGRKVYDQPTHCVKFIHPNPANPGKYVIVYAFNDPGEFARHNRFGLGSESAWKFREGDCVVMGVPAAPRKWGVARDGSPFEEHHLIFDVAWQAESSQPVGELSRAFDNNQILRLRAEAIREAAGADIGVIWSHTPGYLNWKWTLPAGPLTSGVLASMDSLPEYITIGQAKGRTLYSLDRGRTGGLLPGASASTVLTDKRDPAYDPKTSLVLSEIDPEKTYTLAMGYHDLPAFGVQSSKLPDIFCFKSPEEFLASGATSLPVQKMRQLPLEVNEAVLRYVGKRGKVSPRPVCFDLTEYLINPQDNQFGAMDWLHLGADVKWDRPGQAAPLSYRYALNLGLRAVGEPDLAPPRERSKAFVELELAGSAKQSFDFAGLDRKLPVAVGVTVKRSAAKAGAEGGKCSLAEEGEQGAIGRAVLASIAVTNSGGKDIVGLAALCPQAMQNVGGSTWPERRGGEDAPKPYYLGYPHSIGPRNAPPVHEDAALLLWSGAEPAIARHVTPGAGFNFGLVGISRPVELKAGQTVTLPLLLIAVDTAGKGPLLPAVLEDLKDEIMKLAEGPGKAQ